MRLLKGQVFSHTGEPYWWLVHSDNGGSYHCVRVGERDGEYLYTTSASSRDFMEGDVRQLFRDNDIVFYGDESAGPLEVVSDQLNLEAQDGHMTPEQVDAFVERVNARTGQTTLTGVISTTDEEITLTVSFAGPQANLSDALEAFQNTVETMADQRFADCSASINFA